MFDIFYTSSQPTQYPQAVKVKDRNEAREKSRTRFCWLIEGDNDYSKFDFLWEPKPWEAEQVHVWPSQHQDNGGTELIPKEWNGDVNYHQDIVFHHGIEHIVYLEHGNTNNMSMPLLHSSRIYPTRFINDYHGTLKRVISKFKDITDYIWVTSSVCDYSKFDFTWHPSEWQKEMLHVFKSDEQKFGDTFYIHIPTFLEQVGNIELLEWYDTICFNDISVPRHPLPVVLHNCDTQAEAIKEHVFVNGLKNDIFKAPYALFTKEPVSHSRVPTTNLWRPETRTVMPLSKSGDPCLVPKDALVHIKNEVYDYPYISTKHNGRYLDKPLDVIFLSNGEECAEDNYQHLVDTVGLGRVFWVQDVVGRLNAYRECALRSRTDWFFVVYAKLKVNKGFDWSWQPDRLQMPKHYIFNAYNPITGDTYGHMAMIAFNKHLVEQHDGQGVDFSMHQEHEVVPLLSGEAVYAFEPWAAWRTAFREVVKLSASEDPNAKLRLEKWIGANEEWTQKGAKDALAFYAKNPDSVRQTYEWDWLSTYFYDKYQVPSK